MGFDIWANSYDTTNNSKNQDMGHTVIEIGNRAFNPETDTMSLYTFADDLAMFNHVYVELHALKEAYYVFGSLREYRELFRKLTGYVIDNGCNMYLGAQAVSDDDREAYEQQSLAAFEDIDFVPDLPE